MTAAVEFKNVTKHFGSLTAIADISFSVSKGETVALLGPSGCGKTTILRLIAGFYQPDEGIVIIDGQDMTGLKPYERNVGLLFQHYALFPHMTVAENVAYGLRHRGTPKRDIPDRVAEMLNLVRLADFGARRPDQLSGGQQQRVALARALATRPSLVLLDEPLSALDAKLRQDLRVELKQVIATVGSTAIVVTHDQEEAMSLGERIFVMNRGSLMQVGTPDDVYWQPNSRFVADFMGRTNWLSGQIRRAADGQAMFHSGSGWSMPVECRDMTTVHTQMCVRPESIQLLRQDEAARAAGAMHGRITDVVPLGPILQIAIELAGGARLVATQPNRADRAYKPGDSVIVAVPPDACGLFPGEP